MKFNQIIKITLLGHIHNARVIVEKANEFIVELATPLFIGNQEISTVVINRQFVPYILRQIDDKNN